MSRNYQHYFLIHMFHPVITAQTPFSWYDKIFLAKVDYFKLFVEVAIIHKEDNPLL